MPTVKFNSRSGDVPLFVVGAPAYQGPLRLDDAIQGAAEALLAQRAA